MTTHNHPPPGYVTASAAAEIIGHSRQAFYQSGLADWLSSWKIGRMRLYSLADVDEFSSFLSYRAGLIALGVLAGDAPLIPPAAIWNWYQSGDWPSPCPNCGGDALCRDSSPTDPAWCPICGLVE